MCGSGECAYLHSHHGSPWSCAASTARPRATGVLLVIRNCISSQAGKAGPPAGRFDIFCLSLLFASKGCADCLRRRMLEADHVNHQG